MTESEPTVTPEAPAPRPASRLRRFFLRHLPLTLGTIVLLLAAAITGLYFWASSGGFEDLVRRELDSPA